MCSWAADGAPATFFPGEDEDSLGTCPIDPAGRGPMASTCWAPTLIAGACV